MWNNRFSRRCQRLYMRNISSNHLGACELRECEQMHGNAIEGKRVNKINANFDRTQSLSIYGNNQNQWHCQMWRIHYVCVCVRVYVKANHLISRESFIQFSMSTHLCVLFISFEIPIDLCENIWCCVCRWLRIRSNSGCLVFPYVVFSVVRTVLLISASNTRRLGCIEWKQK